jgi:hypothetical protein
VKGLYLPVDDYPQIISDQLQEAKFFVFGDKPITVSTFDSISNYYHYHNDIAIYYPVNKCATYLKRLYTQNYQPLNLVRGDVLIYSSVDKMPHMIDNSVLPYFIDQVMAFMATHDYAFTKN